jgi:hypothetical protein
MRSCAATRYRLLCSAVALASITAAAAVTMRGTALQEHPIGAAGTPIGRAAAIPRTPDGRPDLQGYWVNATVTPLERPPELAGQAYFTEQEARAWERDLPARNARRTDLEGRISPDVTGDWMIPGPAVPSLRTSLIVDPPDGRLPSRLQREPPDPTTFDNPEELGNSERCLVWGEGPPMLPSNIHGNTQIVQTADAVVIVREVIHNARIVKLDRRAHLPAAIRQWTGDSQGRWEGDTLVIDTTNVSDKTRFRGSTAGLHVVERLTLSTPDIITYQFTVEDPATWTRSWAAETALRRSSGPLYEYACHEGNYSMANMLKGSRAAEAR